MTGTRADTRADTVDDAGLGASLREAAVALRAATDAVVRPLGVSVAQYSCLLHLDREPGCSGADVARATYVSRQSTHVLLRAMEADDLVTRTSAPGRAQAWWLTPRGQELLALAHREVVRLDDRVQALADEVVPDGDPRALRRLLEAFVDAVADPAPGAPVT